MDRLTYLCELTGIIDFERSGAYAGVVVIFIGESALKAYIPVCIPSRSLGMKCLDIMNNIFILNIF